MSALDEMYREVVMEHHRNPLGRDPIDRVDAVAKGHNPACGDEVIISLQLEDDQITGIHIEGQGCAISTASGSILADMLEGAPLSESQQIIDDFRELMKEGTMRSEKDLGDLEALVGVRKFPVRVKCAMLPWVTLEQALLSDQDARETKSVSTESERS